MKNFFKFLLLIVLAANLLLLFVFDRLIPTEVHLPFDLGGSESTVTVEPENEIQTTDIVDETVPAEEPKEESEPETEPETELPQEEILPVSRIISAEGSNVRSGPGSGYDVIGIYPYDTVLMVTGEAVNGWYPIRTEDGTEGYIFESQVTVPEEAATETVGEYENENAGDMVRSNYLLIEDRTLPNSSDTITDDECLEITTDANLLDFGINYEYTYL
jgi:uncharacterized protein YgiM (DUF1202 family)